MYTNGFLVQKNRNANLFFTAKLIFEEKTHVLTTFSPSSKAEKLKVEGATYIYFTAL